VNSLVSRRRSALTFVDYIVIMATALTFVAIVAVNGPHARKATDSYLLQDTSPRTGKNHDQPDLARARVKLATGI
jgi:hypothetical protein